jgi:hypothetical protein
MGRDLDAEGITVIALDGGAGIGAYLRLFGPGGLGISVLGMCDEDKETQWQTELQKAGFPATSRQAMQQAGFKVCVKDLEEEFISAMGATAVQGVIASEGDAAAFAAFQGQPTQASVSLPEQLRRFLHKNNTRYAIPLVDALDLKAIPAVPKDLLSGL